MAGSRVSRYGSAGGASLLLLLSSQRSSVKISLASRPLNAWLTYKSLNRSKVCLELLKAAA
eukprot:5053-Heterococcus_DN1.PRE.2